MKLGFVLIVLLCNLAVNVLGKYFSVENDRHYYPEFMFRAKAASHDEARRGELKNTLASAAGVYSNKSHAEEFGIQSTVFITVLEFSEKAYYKLYLYNLLCFAKHHGIEVVIYVLNHNMSLRDWKQEKSAYDTMGIRLVSYPDELFWTLLYSKSNEIRIAKAGKVDYEAKVPSFSSHGALVMLVPTLEVLLSGYDCIYFDLDIALVLDPIPFLTRGRSDFVTTIEMRHCPDTYRPTHRNKSTTAHAHRKPAGKVVNGMESFNWYSSEPNTGIMLVRSTEAGIGLFTKWLLRIIHENVLNDQKVLYWTGYFHSFDCMYGGHYAHHHGQTTLRRGVAKNSPLHQRWALNFTALIEDVQLDRVDQKARFCFLSEILFQNGQTAFTCGGKPSFKDSWILNMYEHGLRNSDALYSAEAEAPNSQSSQIINMEKNNNNNDNNSNNNTARFVVLVHANFCDRKSHELEVRGLWLVQHSDVTLPFGKDTCKAYDPYKTMYGQRNWTAENLEVVNKRNYMYDTFVQQGQLIQSTNGNEVYLVNAQRQKQMIPDGDTFIATMGDDKWGDVRFLPQPLMDLVPTGPGIPSVRSIAPSDTPTAEPTSPDILPPVTSTYILEPALGSKPSHVTLLDENQATASASADLLVRREHPQEDLKQSTVQATITENNHQSKVLHPTVPIVAGMLARSPSTATVYYIDKKKHKRRVQNMNAFVRLFGRRTKDIVVIPDVILATIPSGEPII